MTRETWWALVAYPIAPDNCPTSIPKSRAVASIPTASALPQRSLPVFNVGLSSHRKITPVQGKSCRHETTICVLPDDVLLEIVDCYQKDLRYITASRWKWYLLTHICRRWRQIVFESPHRLNLQIHCTYGTPVRVNLDIWPAIPIAIDFRYPCDDDLPSDEEDNVIAALEHPDRVCYLGLKVMRLQLKRMATVMREPFPVLARLNISSKSQRAPVLPAEFLGGSAPCLQKFQLSGISFPALPTLLMSASNLVLLVLQRIPPTGYISPEAMVACLAPMHRLRIFAILFQLATLHPGRIQSPSITRTVLPALTHFVFQGASEYLEDLVVQIDCPQLNRISIEYSSQLFAFGVTQLSKFVDRSVGPKLSPLGHASLNFFCGQADLTFIYYYIGHDMYIYANLTMDLSRSILDESSLHTHDHSESSSQGHKCLDSRELEPFRTPAVRNVNDAWVTWKHGGKRQ
ncbi:hypothetical protein EDB89DRAFT_1906715 [Lactarius sanguifluus]|nr:hypothetical protein EDB89DRAFT_1906715 [Lactarius sanguifluus]